MEEINFDHFMKIAQNDLKGHKSCYTFEWLEPWDESRMLNSTTFRQKKKSVYIPLFWDSTKSVQSSIISEEYNWHLKKGI